MNNISIIRRIALMVSIVFFTSCDKNYNSIGGDVVGDDDFEFKVDSTYKIVAFNRTTGPVQTNALAINSLGIYNSPVFGKTTANFVTQLSLATEGPIIGTNPKVTEVTLYIPYFSTVQSKNADGDTTYKLDSIFKSGTGDNSIILNIYESGYYLRDFDPNDAFRPQRFYSSQNELINTNKIGQRLNDASNAIQNDAFVFSSVEHKVANADGKTERVKPGMRLTLNTAFFQAKIFGAGASEKLANNNVFREYLRGLYFQVESIAGNEVLAKMKFTDGTITIKYTEDAATVGEEPVNKTIILNLTGNTMNLLQNEFTTGYSNALATSNPTAGNDRIYIKGGEGSVAYIDLFNEQEIEEIRAKKWLINEANLEFYVDQNVMNGASQPQRIFLYDTKRNMPILDYYSDGTRNTNTKLNKNILGGIIEKDSKNGYKYKIRLTEHINSILNKDSINVRLGLVVMEDINQISNAYLETPYETITKLPAYSVINHLGTVLYGTTATVPEDKRLKLKIYYTKPN